jgi:hypothetical protein
MHLRVLSVGWRDNREVRLKEPMPENAQALKHRSAEDHRINKGCSVYILDDVGEARLNQHIAHWLNQPGPHVAVAVTFGEIGIRLAGRRGVDCIKRGDKLRIELERVTLDKPERKVTLRLVVHANNFKSSPAVSNSRAASAAEKVEQAKFF